MNHNQILKRRNNLKLALLYILMAFSVVIIVIFIIFFILGYRFDVDKGQIEQYSFLQFNSQPSGATVKVDGVILSSKTPSKTALPAGKHEIIMQREGYQQWQKTIEVKSGTLTWLDYALLIPKKITVEPVANYISLHNSLVSPEGRNLIVHESVSDTSFTLVDMSSDVIKSAKITLPTDVYSGVADSLITHAFKLVRWDQNGRYVLVEHIYGNISEWLVIDTQDVAQSSNVSQLFDIAISDIEFSGTTGNIFFVLNSGDIRKVNLSDETISKPLVSGVAEFNVYAETNVISYVGTSSTDINKRVVGLFRDGDSKPHVLRTIASSDVLKIISSRYFNEDYVAILEGKKLDILRGSYPSSDSESMTSLKLLTSLNVENTVMNMSFSPAGQYLLIRAGSDFVSFDLEYQKTASFKLVGTAEAFNFGWLGDNYIWSDRDDKLTICEFDGTNTHDINNTLNGQDIALTHNNRYIYSFVKTESAYQLQRVRLTLP